jgi:hypothetical protein
MLNQAANVMVIEEREWGTGQPIQFTKFTSCIGVLAKVAGQNQVIGIHLSILDENGNVFTAAVVPQITGVLAGQGYDNTTCQIFGMIDIWENELPAAYGALVAALNNPVQAQREDGTYQVAIVNGAIKIDEIVPAH